MEDQDYIIETDEPTEGELDHTNKKRFPVFAQLVLLAMVLAIIFGGAYLPTYLESREDLQSPTSQTAALGVHTTPTPEIIPKLENISIEAEAAYVFDIRTQRVLYGKNEGEIFPLASITKLMTALVAFETISGEETVRIPLSAVYQEGDSGLYDGETIDATTLSQYALISSSNDAAYALAEAAGDILVEDGGADVFVKGMNARADELGLESLHFYNPTGLDLSPSRSGAFGSARDVSFLMEYMLKHYPELLEPTQRLAKRVFNEAGEYHDVENTNIILTEIPNLLGSKTGYTDIAGGNLTIIFNAGLDRPIVVTVLGSSWNGRFSDVLTLVDAVQKQIQSTSSVAKE